MRHGYHRSHLITVNGAITGGIAFIIRITALTVIADIKKLVVVALRYRLSERDARTEAILRKAERVGFTQRRYLYYSIAPQKNNVTYHNRPINHP